MASHHPFRSTLLGIAALTASGLAFPSLASAQNVWFVSLNGGGTGASWASTTTLDNALALSSPGDFIRVRQEATPYRPTVPTSPFDARSMTFNITKSLNIRGGYLGNEPGARPNGSSEATVLDGDLGILGVQTDNAYHVVTVATKNPVSIQGFRIQYGNADIYGPAVPTDPRTKGGGIHAISGAQLQVGFVSLTDNGAVDRGAALYLTNATAMLRQVTIRLNSGISGGFGSGISAESTELDVVNGRFFHNGFGVLGGALYLVGGKSRLTNCVFLDNFVEGPGCTGGAVYLASSNHSVFSNCTFGNNLAQAGSPTSALIIDNSNNPNGTCALRNTIVWPTDQWNGVDPLFLGDALAGFAGFTAQFSDIRRLPTTLVYPDSINFPVNTNVNVDPSFGDLAALSLSSTSTLLGAGNLALLPSDVSDIDNDGNFFETLPLDRERAARTVTMTTPPFATFVAMGAIQAPNISFVIP